MHCIKHAHKMGVKSVTLTSGAVTERPMPGATLMSAFAGAIQAALRTAAVDCAPMRINCISPGVVDTEALAVLPAERRSGLFMPLKQKLPVRHVSTPEELAEAVNVGFFATPLYLIDVNGAHSTSSR
jgi:NAD(P)-dependent dehydrogenase (short-subunit alcohol dehydrogenase family)